jgi:hypothetical protein
MHLSSVISQIICIIAFAIMQIMPYKSRAQSKLEVKESTVDISAPIEGLKALSRIIARSILTGTRKHSAEKTLEESDEFENVP